MDIPAAHDRHNEQGTAMLEQAPCPLLITRMDDGRLLYCNVRARQLFGLDGETCRSVSIEQFYHHPADRADLLDTLRHDGFVVEREQEFVDRQGRAFPALVSSTLMEYGTQPALLSVITDISQRRQAEQALQQERAQLRARTERLQLHNQLLGRLSTAQTAIDGDLPAFAREVTELLAESLDIARVSVWMFREADDAAGQLICLDLYEQASRTHTRGQILHGEMFRRELPELATRRFVAASDPLSDPRTAAYGPAYLTPLGITSLLDCGIVSGGRTRGVICFEHVRRPHYWEADEIAFGCQVADQLGMVLLTDERLQVVQSLHRSEQLLKQAQEVAQTGYWHFDFATRTLSLSDETYRIFDAPAGSMRSIEAFNRMVPPEDRPLIEQQWRIARQGAPYRVRHRILVGGVVKWLEERASIEFDGQGKPIQALGTTQDITRQMEDQFRLERLNRVYAMLGHSNEAIARVRDPERLFAEICHIVVNEGGFDAAWIGQANANGQIAVLARVGLDDDALARLDLSLAGVSPAARALRAGTTQLDDQAMETRPIDRSPEDAATSATHPSSAAFPVLIDDEPRIVLHIHAQDKHRFDDQHIELFARLAGNFGIALELAAARAAELNAVNERLRVSEERHAFALEASNDGLWDWDLDTGRVYCSPSFFTMLGYTPGELVPHIQSWHELVHPDDRAWVSAEAYRRIAEEGGFELEYRSRTKDGRSLWVLSRGKVVARAPDGRPLRVVGVHTDLTTHKRIELELRTVAEEQQAILNAAPVGICFIKDRTVVRCNRKLEEIFGHAPGAMAGTSTLPWYESEAEYQEIGRTIAHALKEQALFHAERQLVRQDGSRFWARMTAQALAPGDLSKGLVGMLEDITDEREASAALHAAKERAEAATRAKSEFLANMSHEIRTPMNAILGFAHLIKRDPLTPSQLAQLEKLSAATHHLLNIINDILDISKIEANKMELGVEDFDLARIIDRIAALVADSVLAKHLELFVDLDHVPSMLRGDGSRLGQILLNVVSNAIKFTEQGAVGITVRVVDAREDRPVLRFEIRDTGIGMSVEQVERAFLPFEQADSSMTRRFGGTGLGLTISRQLVELMGGRMGVESELGHGTLCWLEIPFEVSPQAPAAMGTGEGFAALRALVIDDCQASREILAAMLRTLGMRVTTAASGAGGLDELRRGFGETGKYDLLIVDWHLAGMSGLEILHRVRNLDQARRPPLVMIAAYGGQVPGEAVARSGACKVLAKPVTPSLLHDALAETVPPVARREPPLSATERELARRRGAHILLVEDNMVNQEVACLLLEGMGMRVSLADNGKSAVEMVDKTSFDLVLMDIQMPIMNGLHATAAIRRLPGGRSLPILAMTANAFNEDREQSLRAGMNDHIAKPIELAKLHELLIKWLPPRQDLPAAAGGDPPLLPGDARLRQTDLLARLQAVDGLEATAGLKLLRGDASRYVQVLRQFVDQHGQDGIELARQAKSGAFGAIRQTAHALKGAAGTLGARRIEQLAADLERLAHGGSDAASLRNRIDLVGAALTDLVGTVRELAKSVPSVAEAAVVDRQQVEEVLAALESLLGRDDTSANEVFDQAQPQLLAAFGEQARRLGRQIHDFDYADALRAIRGLRGEQAGQP